MTRTLAALAIAILIWGTTLAQSTQPADLTRYDADFFPNAQHDPAVPTPEKLIGPDNGRAVHAATHAQIETCFKAWANHPRCKLVEYAKSHEGRALYYMVITSPANQQKLDQIKADLGKLADPRKSNDEELNRLIESTPAPAWFAYNIHGDETSGADAAIQFAYHLIAATDDATTKLLENHIICIDPCMNPDGRDRHLTQMRENRTRGVSLDDQSLLATGFWPSGRMNHYLFDLNRDWIFCTQPETKGRVKAIGEWHPLLLIDAHEMGPQDTYLFSPPREAINPNIPKETQRWWHVFAKDHAAAFDRNGWRYYAGEWNDEWYPGYSSSWAGYRGAVGILYEQAHAGEDGIRLESGNVMSFRRAVHQQLVSSLANLDTFAKNSREMMKQFAAQKKANVAADGKYAKRFWAIPPSTNLNRLNALIAALHVQGIEVLTLQEALRLSGKNRLGESFNDRELPRGTIIIPNRQPQAPLVSGVLEFDTKFSEEILTAERREILRTGGSKVYDTTAWNLGMFFDVQMYEIDGPVPANANRFEGFWDFDGAPAPAGLIRQREPAEVGYVIRDNDHAVAAAARLMDQGIRVRIAQRDFKFGNSEFGRGAIVVSVDENRAFNGELRESVQQASRGLFQNIDTGLGEKGEDPSDPVDLGGEHFRLLAKPKIALVGREPFEAYSYGSAWYAIDHILGIRASYIDASNLNEADLRRYNVLILPDSRGMKSVERVRDDLKKWVEQGGTLIAFGDTAAELIAKEEKDKVSKVSLFGDVLEKLADFEVQVMREFEARNLKINPDEIAAHTLPTSVRYFWHNLPEREKLDKEELARRNDWQRTFNPQGAIVAARVDDRHWLTFGCREYLPVLVNGRVPLMAMDGIEAPLRLGVYRKLPTPPESASAAAASAPSTAPTTQPDAKPSTWARTPNGYELRLRMAGLLWPEAADRLANTAYVTREGLGKGQIILFSVTPTFRAATLGPQRVFLNSVVYGPGCGTTPRVEP